MIGTEDDSGLCHIHNPDRHCGAALTNGICTMQAGVSGFCWKHAPPKPRTTRTAELHGYGPPAGYYYDAEGQAQPYPIEEVSDPLRAAEAVRTATRRLVLGGHTTGAQTSTTAILREAAEAIRDLGALGWQATADDELRRVSEELAGRMEAHADRASY